MSPYFQQSQDSRTAFLGNSDIVWRATVAVSRMKHGLHAWPRKQEVKDIFIPDVSRDV